jgi:arylsulfatase A-like enzyme
MPPPATNRRPNLLWVMCDQMRADALGCVSPWMHTPNLDALAGGGVRLSHLFAQSPVCVPSRCNMVTGRYPHAHRCRENHARLGPGEPHLFRALKAAGYRTGLVGKNHMFDPRDLAPLDIDGSAVGEKAGLPADWEAHLKQIGRDMVVRGAWAGARFHDLPEEFSSTHRIGAAGLEALDRLAAGPDPFFLWVSFHDPHAPHTAPRRFEALYPPESVPLPDGALGPTAGTELARGKPRRQAVKRDAQKMPDAAEDDLRRYVAVYSAMVSYVDEWVGRLLDRLDELGRREDTLVLFVSDHGDFRGEHAMVKKDLVLYDSLLRVPGVLRLPGGLPAGAVHDGLCETVDLYPTLCDLLDVSVPHGVQGRSLAPVLRGTAEDEREAVYAEVCPPNFRNPYPDSAAFLAEWERAQTTEGHPLRWTAPFNVPGDFVKCVRTRDRKYVWYPNSGEEELYDLTTDPGETANLAADPRRAGEKADLRARLLEWAVRTEDPRDPLNDQRLAHDLPWGEPTILKEPAR